MSDDDIAADWTLRCAYLVRLLTDGEPEETPPGESSARRAAALADLFRRADGRPISAMAACGGVGTLLPTGNLTPAWQTSDQRPVPATAAAIRGCGWETIPPG
jgi:hypothetical protein